MSDIAAIIVIITRTLIPFLILKLPLIGAIASMIADALDVMLFEIFWYGFLEGISYHYIDKIFDMWYLLFEFLIVLTWKDKLAKKTGKILFFWRLAGFVLFMITGLRIFFVLAPNIFEYFFLAMLIIWLFKKDFRLDKKSLTIILLIVGIPNIIKEYIMHYAFENQTWVFFRDNLFSWIYS